MVEGLDDLGRSFARRLRAESLSERTVAIYGQSVRLDAAWLEEQGRPTTQSEVSRGAIREWLSHPHRHRAAARRMERGDRV